MELKSSNIGKAKPNIVLGTVCVLLSFALGYIYFIWSGMPSAGLLIQCFAVVILLYFAWVNFSGYCPVKCPYCDKDVRIKRTAQSLKCEFCKNVSVRKGDMLEEVKRN